MAKKRKGLRIILAAVIFTAIAQVIRSLCAMLGMKYYMDPKYFDVWSKLMMPTAGPPPASFLLYSILFGLITALLIVIVYNIIKKGIPGKTLVKKGLWYGLILFLAAGIPGSLALKLLINLPCGLITLWAAESLVIYLLGGMVIAKLVK